MPTQAISHGEFIVEYAGELIDGEEGERRELDGKPSVFRYFFKHQNSSMW